jgi:homoserine O-acetyltransferase
MDSHNVARGRDNAEKVLAQIKTRTLVIGIDSDILFPIAEQEYLAKHIPHAKLELMPSLYGHDGFLVEFEQMNNILKQFIKEKINIVS